MSPALAHLSSGREVMLGACRLPDSTSLFISMTQPVIRPGARAARERDRASGALTEKGFATALSERMAEGADGDELALLDLGDLDKLMAMTDPEHKRQLMQTIGEILGEAAGDDGIAGRLGDGRFGVVAAKPIDEQALARDLTDATPRPCRRRRR
jgi:GGDEF domain-containing protein